MIVCVSVNPAVDRRLTVGDFAVGEVHRARSVAAEAGGKAAHVAYAALALGEDVLWIGFSGGAVGAEHQKGLAEAGVDTVAIPTASPTRYTVEIVDEHGVSTEVLEPGGAVSESELLAFVAACEQRFADYGHEAVVVMSGSLRPGVPAHVYATLTEMAAAHGCRTIVDASGAALRASLSTAPDLLKPNRTEAAELAGDEDAVEWLVAAGAKGVAVTRGAGGIVWLPRPGARAIAATGPVVAGRSAVGCGDATAAGFAVGFARGLSDEETMRLAIACGTANCLAPSPGLISRDEVNWIAREVVLKKE